MDQQAIDRFQFAGQDLFWLVDHWAQHRPDHPFLVWEPRDGVHETWTYARFREDVERLAAGLAGRGVGPGDKVLIHAENCPEMVLAWYACARLRAVGVTTNTRSVGPEIEYFASKTGSVGAITQPQFASLVAAHAPDLGWIVVTDDDGGEPAEATHEFDSFQSLYGVADDCPAHEPDPMAPVGIMFTSGTTSLPKAVVHTHANALWAARVGPTNIAMEADDVYLIYLPFFHVNAQSWSTWSALGVGGTIVLQPKFSASRFWEVVVKHSVTHISLIPFVFKAVAGQERPEHTLKVGVFGLIMPVLEGLLGCRVIPAYGMTELVTHAIHGNLTERYPERSMGKPTPGYELAVVDPDTGELCDDGRVGELWVRATRGVQIFLEYLDDPEANAKAFTDDGWFRTGDMVRLGEEGNWFFSERDKDALKVGGENVSAKEVEDVCRAVPGIADIAVVAKSHEMLDQVPVAYVIKSPDAPSDDELAAAILGHCEGALADFKRPRAVYVVDDFPRATLDKIAKNQLREDADTRPAV